MLLLPVGGLKGVISTGQKAVLDEASTSGWWCLVDLGGELASRGWQTLGDGLWPCWRRGRAGIVGLNFLEVEGDSAPHRPGPTTFDLSPWRGPRCRSPGAEIRRPLPHGRL